MPSGRQFYGGDGVPIEVPGTPEQVATAWRSHRERLRGWLADLDDDQWSAPTRCPAWRTREMVQHLISAAAFLGYTLHQCRCGEATRLLEGFDPQATPALAAAQFAGMSTRELLDELHATDARVAAEISAFSEDDWRSPAEAPPGHVPAYVSLDHFLFDSWVHERDVMLPVGETPPTVPDEAALVASYVAGLSGVAYVIGTSPPPDVSLRLDLTDLDRCLSVEVRAGRTTVGFDGPGEPNASATAGDLVDFATGRTSEAAVAVDEKSARFLRGLAALMA